MPYLLLMISMHLCRMEFDWGWHASTSTWLHSIMVKVGMMGERGSGDSWLGILIFVRRTALMPSQFTLEKSNRITDKCPGHLIPTSPPPHENRNLKKSTRKSKVSIYFRQFEISLAICVALLLAACSSNGKRLRQIKESVRS